MREIEIMDIVGDEKNLIVRIVDEEKRPKGLWFGRNISGEWNCLHLDVDKDFAGLVINHEKVQMKIANL